MRKNLGGGSKLIEARLRAYADAVKRGATQAEALAEARGISQRSLRKVGK